MKNCYFQCMDKELLYRAWKSEAGIAIRYSVAAIGAGWATYDLIKKRKMPPPFGAREK